ncbi:hypothetical protein AgCh_014666 [Apium graveolens]
MNSVEELFCRLALPYVPEEFVIDKTWKYAIVIEMEPPPYVHIKRNRKLWLGEAAEFVNKGDFIIEYVGEVISNAMCEQRLWDMKHLGTQNFYLVEVEKDLTIDSTFKGNSSRFLNHSCNPNCDLEKWQLDGETRIGIFAAQSIQAGEPLTYDYKFIQYGSEVKCQCGAPNCCGSLGAPNSGSG